MNQTAAATDAPAGDKKSLAAEKKPPPVMKPVENEKQPVETGAAVPAGQKFASGNFSAAADIWRGELLAAQVKYSILLEMDCLKASVRIAYRQVGDKENFFLLNKTSRDGRRCWLVLWGRYRTAAEAALGMKLIPQYFWKQSEPPAVIELEPYL
jgi:hypothetical protein